MKIAPEDGAGEDGEATPGFRAETVVVVVVLMVGLLGYRRRECWD